MRGLARDALVAFDGVFDARAGAVARLEPVALRSGGELGRGGAGEAAGGDVGDCGRVSGAWRGEGKNVHGEDWRERWSAGASLMRSSTSSPGSAYEMRPRLRFVPLSSCSSSSLTISLAFPLPLYPPAFVSTSTTNELCPFLGTDHPPLVTTSSSELLPPISSSPKASIRRFGCSRAVGKGSLQLPVRGGAAEAARGGAKEKEVETGWERERREGGSA